MSTSPLDDAVRAAMEHVEPGRPVIGWVVVAAVLPDDETESRLSVLQPEGQQPYAAAGLLHTALTQNVSSS